MRTITVFPDMMCNYIVRLIGVARRLADHIVFLLLGKRSLGRES
jgi:hypothetical protein